MNLEIGSGGVYTMGTENELLVDGDELIAEVHGKTPEEARVRARQIVAALRESDAAERLAEVVRETLATLRAATALATPDGRALFTREQLVGMATTSLAAWNEAKGEG